jgi:glycosyltransferase involved in cell wall biosynthesis
LIICDNASTDRTAEICHTYAEKDSRIRYVRNETNLGASRNYMRTFELSSAEYFRWATCDDVNGTEFLARCIEVLDRQPTVVLAYPKTKLIDEHGQVISEYEDRLHLPSPVASERFIGLLQNLRLCNAIYGLIRARVLKRMAPLGSFTGADICFMAELTLYGSFYEIPEFLFYRRMHPGAFSSQSAEKQLEFYNPQVKRHRSLVKWRQYWQHFATVARSPLALGEKLYLDAHLVRLAMWDRQALGRELLLASQQQSKKFRMQFSWNNEKRN